MTAKKRFRDRLPGPAMTMTAALIEVRGFVMALFIR